MTRYSFMSAIFVIIIIWVLVALIPSRDGAIKSRFDKVKLGMTSQQVAGIFDEMATDNEFDTDDGKVGFEWRGRNVKAVLILDSNNRIEKKEWWSKYGLWQNLWRCQENTWLLVE
jgi:hypothetical protein